MKNKLSDFQKNISLSQYTTFRLGGPAKYFYQAENSEQVIEAIKTAQENQLDFFILGGGSNLLASDQGFDGLSIKMRNMELKVEGNKIIAGAGAGLGQVVAYSVKNGLSGLEWAIGIPGTLGGAVYGNAGAFGHSLAESVLEARALKIQTGKVKQYRNQACGFEYRGSIFKKNKEIILSIILSLKKTSPQETQNIMRQYLEIRKDKAIPYPSAGSVFKNLLIKNLSQEFIKTIPSDKIKGGKIPVAYVIEQCGLKGKEVNGARIYEKHANTMINFNQAKTADVMALIALCKKEVKNKFNINLEEEIQYLGF